MNRALNSGRPAFLAGLAAGVGVCIAGAVAWSQTAGGPAAQAKPAYTTVLENERVRVRDVTFPPGVLDTGMHTHTYAHVGIILSDGALQFIDPSGKTERVEFKAGSVGFREANATHQVGNPGPAPMRVIEVELKP
jgi:mannose-6-phosphate isomerase-like protein (cupin superfamily)